MKTIARLAAAALAASAVTVLVLGAVTGTPGCQVAGHRLPVSATIAVDAAGNASGPYDGTGQGYVCTPSGAWHRI